MGNSFALRLACQNLRKNRRFYLPYLLSGILVMAMYFIMVSLAENRSLGEAKGGGSMLTMLSLGCWVITILAAILLLYANSFLMKRRQLEFGLYSVLGMEKRHIGRVLLWETVLSFLIVLFGGVLAGLILQRLMFLILLKITALPVTFTMELSAAALSKTAARAVVIFLLTLVFNLLRIRRSNPAALLQGARAGEREPKAKWLLAAAGVVCLGVGYFIALTVESPVEALGWFFVAILFITAGTYALFTAGSVALLKLLRRRKKFYYQPRHFTSVSGLMYRMKQNAVGLASICILSAGVLLMISSTASLYIGMNDLLDNRFSRDLMLETYDADDGKETEVLDTLDALADQYGVTLTDPERYHMLTTTYWPEESGPESVSVLVVNAITAAEYGRLTGETVSLAPDEVLLYDPANGAIGDTVTFGSTAFRVQAALDSFPLEEAEEDQSWMMVHYRTYYAVMDSEQTILSLHNDQLAQYDPEAMRSQSLSWYFRCDLDGDRDALRAFSMQARTDVMGLGRTTVEAKYESLDSFYAMYGSLLFVGIFLGVLFFGATALIIYYKQISEGYEDQARFTIMQQVGMSREEVKRSIHSQILLVFFLPLGTAVVHMAVCFPAVTKVLVLMNLTNQPLFLACLAGTVLVFALLYALVYGLTARIYYRIVRAA